MTGKYILIILTQVLAYDYKWRKGGKQKQSMMLLRFWKESDSLNMFSFSEYLFAAC